MGLLWNGPINELYLLFFCRALSRAMVICLVIGCCMYFFTNEFQKDSSDHSSQLVAKNLTRQGASDRNEMVILGSGRNVVGSAVDDQGIHKREGLASELALDEAVEYIKQFNEKFPNPAVVLIYGWPDGKVDAHGFGSEDVPVPSSMN